MKLLFAEKIIEIIKKFKEHIQNDLLIEAYKATFIILNDIVNLFVIENLR